MDQWTVLRATELTQRIDAASGQHMISDASLTRITLVELQDFHVSTNSILESTRVNESV